MIVRCPSCGFQGNIRIPEHVPVGRSVRIRCARCRSPFALNVGRLFPQEQGYAAIAPETRPCRGERLGNLWVETTGAPVGRQPLIALPAHPALSHEILHDLLDRFGEYFQVCYVEFPGSARNPAEVQGADCAAWLSDSLPAIKSRLGASRVHLLAHLASAPTALRVAAEQPDEIASLVLLEPDLCLARRLKGMRFAGELELLRSERGEGVDREELARALLGRVWELPLEEQHLAGLARIFGAGLSLPLLRRDIRECRPLPYRRLARLKTPVLLFSARDSRDRGDALYLQATLPSVETAALDKGGAMAAWFGSTWFAGKLQAFKRSAELGASLAAAAPRDAGSTAGRQREGRGASPRPRGQTLNGQPAGWLLALYALLACGLTALLQDLSFQPAWLQPLLPQLLAALLPIVWLLLPRRINPFPFLRFRGLSLGTTAVPLLAGALLGAAFRLLLAAAPQLARAARGLPPRLLSLPVGSPGRFAVFAAAGAAALLAYGAAANLLLLRRSRWALWLPALVFAVFPMSWPDLLWRLPASLLAGLLFARSLSILGPLCLLGGIGLGCELRALWTWTPLERLLQPAGWPGPAAAGALAAAAAVLVLLAGGRGASIPAEKRYFAATLASAQRTLRWEPTLGIVLVVFSLIAAVAAIFLFLAV